MKIAYLHQYFNPGTGATGSRSYEFAKRLVAAGHDVHMIAARSSEAHTSAGWQVETVDGITVHWCSVPYSNRMSFRRRILAFVQFAALSARRARSVRADLVFATSTPLTIILPARFATLFRRTPIVFEVRDLWPTMPIALGVLKNPVMIGIAKALEKWAYRSARRVVALSPGMRDGVIARGYPAERIEVIPNSCDLADFQRVSDEAVTAWRSSHEWLGDRPLIVYCGTFGLVNGVEYLAEVAAAAAQLNPELRFVAMGDGARREAVRERAQELGVLDSNFFILSPVPKAQVPVVFAAATVSTSLFIPVKEMEANSANKFFDGLAAGRPIAINYGGWQAEALTESGAGIVLSADDHQSAARRLVNLVSDEAELRRKRAAASHLASAFSRDVLAQKFISTLEDARHT
ncbi:glycosyltransferase family 4 protein [Salinibacterium sp. SYSU T00001]|uniref:glycosyltransferase family 4 protein n=1 Tax=Homoserinimonas sedimenticola TaxID=2986805 RepID=UPI0022368CE1|nr:glycosyltransferase family 4 protein [Salinibacterium sedimenticola]MCW4385034.1 glycosyltransferase family 4 protein [Salinibacterium sedimenticola]